MASSLSNFADNLAGGIHKIKCKHCDCFLDYRIVNNKLINYNGLFWNKNYSNKIDDELKSRFKKTIKFSNNDINRFILL